MRIVSVWIVLACLAATIQARTLVLTSPGGNLVVSIETDGQLRYSVIHRGQLLVQDNPLSLTVEKDVVLGRDSHLKTAETQTGLRQTVRPVVPTRHEVIEAEYCQAVLRFIEGFQVIFRAYDDAVAYRFITERTGPLRVVGEQVRFNFTADHRVFFGEERSFHTAQEVTFTPTPLSQIGPDRFCSLPLLVDIAGGPKVALAEADLRDYPGLFLQGTGETAVEGRWPGYPLEVRQDNDRTVRVTRAADWLADTQGARSFPWRVLIVAEKDADLLENDTIFLLAAPSRLEDTSWIKPGKVAWDWWNANNIWGVDFRAGVNTQTYRHYIDFAAENGIEYVILDEGWYQLGDLLRPNPDMDMEGLFAYAKSKNVGLIPWVVWKTLDDQLEPALDQFVRWGAVGLKIDFMDRCDQWMVDYYERILQATAKRHLMVDFHGAYTPRGLRRTYPHLMTREGVKGLEHSKWSEDVSPDHDVTLPFTRMLAGPMDFTPGAMHNTQRTNFHARFSRPMSQGTRCHQMAMFVVYESPWQMLADSPTMYRREQPCLVFLRDVPATWHQTVGLDGRVGDYVVVARRHGDDWYLAAMTDWEPRELTVELSFLPAGSFTATVFQDGPNADRCAEDFQRRRMRVSQSSRLSVKLAPGGGWVARLQPDRS